MLHRVKLEIWLLSPLKAQTEWIMRQESDRCHPLEGLGIKGHFLDLQGNFFPSSNRPTQSLVQTQEGRTDPTETCLVICVNSRKSSRKRRKASSLYQCSLLCTFRLSLGHTAGTVPLSVHGTRHVSSLVFTSSSLLRVSLF